jgi:hypothetical protein
LKSPEVFEASWSFVESFEVLWSLMKSLEVSWSFLKSFEVFRKFEVSDVEVSDVEVSWSLLKSWSLLFPPWVIFVLIEGVLACHLFYKERRCIYFEKNPL